MPAGTTSFSKLAFRVSLASPDVEDEPPSTPRHLIPATPQSALARVKSRRALSDVASGGVTPPPPKTLVIAGDTKSSTLRATYAAIVHVLSMPSLFSTCQLLTAAFAAVVLLATRFAVPVPAKLRATLFKLARLLAQYPALLVTAILGTRASAAEQAVTRVADVELALAEAWTTL